MREELIAAVFPRRCAICDKVIEASANVCRECGTRVHPIRGATCMKCGKKLSDSERMYCYDCGRKLHHFDRGWAIFEYEDVRKSLYRFKYAGRAEYGRFYAEAADMYLGEVLRSLHADAIIPVPIHRRRMRMRGYNQASVFAHELGVRIDVPVLDDYIIRQKATIPLKKLGESERRNNLKKAFIIGPNVVKLSTIIIIDDIYTTGATIDTISNVCREGGIKHIYFLTVAIGSGL